MRSARRGVTTAALACAALVSCSDGEEARQRDETRRIMHEIYGGLRVALPASADAERFRDPEGAAEIAAALDALATNAALLERHTTRHDEQMHFLARSVARDADELQRAYAAGRSNRAAFLLHQIVENCVVCHTRLPGGDSALTEGFVDADVFEELPLEPRATLQIATRRFDDALDTLEALLLSPVEHPALMLGPLTDYLVVSLRVKGDYRRPIPVLQRFASREDLWERLRLDVERWIAALPDLERRARRRPSVETARALLDEGRLPEALPEDHSDLAHWVAASAILERFIDGWQSPDAKLAEAYYLLGVAEARIGRNYWVTPAPFLLEHAIRLAPHADFARVAYAMLEHETLMAYEGTDEQDLPEADATRLAELKALIEGR